MIESFVIVGSFDYDYTQLQLHIIVANMLAH
jgi:hypothetical protein